MQNLPIDFSLPKSIEVIMMTGDNEATAKHVAESLALKIILQLSSSRQNKC